MPHDLPLMRTFPPMHGHVPLSTARREIEAHKQHVDQALQQYNTDMQSSLDKYKRGMEHLFQLHVQEASALLDMAIEVNADLQRIIAQQQADNTKRIAQLEAQLEAEKMNAFRCYMSGSHKTAAETSSLDLWDEAEALHANANANACSAQSIHDFLHIPTFDQSL